MKVRNVILIILLILFADQALKIYIKTHFFLGEKTSVIGDWFYLEFLENEGMAYGWKFGGQWGKLFLTLFRLVAVGFGVWYLKNIIEKKYHKGFIICVALIFAGAVGNLIDSLFYGLIFDKGMIANATTNQLSGYEGIAKFSNKGYASFLHGSVVDMLHFPLIEGKFPSWFPIWGREDFEFFRPIFNIADMAISTGVISIFVFQKKFFSSQKTEQATTTVETNAVVNDDVQVL